MTSAATAKILLFIAVSLGPKSTPGTILATSPSDNYAWSYTGEAWELSTKGLPAEDWTGAGSQVREGRQGREMWAIARHAWAKDPILDLEDGSQVMKQNGAVFYIQDPGAPNQKVFTILYSDES